MTDDDAAVPLGQRQALMPVAGMVLIEYQVRMARACGVGHIVVLVDEVPAGLVEAFDRLRSDGIDIDVARSAQDAADRIHPDEQLLVMASGAVAAQSVLHRMILQPKPSLLTIKDTPETAHYERIDREDRWTGIALLNGQILRQTSAMLGDWTLGPTLLRAALQSGVERVRHEGGAAIALVQNEAAAITISHALADGHASVQERGFIQAGVAQLTKRIAPLLLEKRIPLDLLAVLPLILVATALLVAVKGWMAMSFLIFLISTIPAAAAQMMGAISARPTTPLLWYHRTKLYGFLLIIASLAWHLRYNGSGWGVWTLALWVSVTLILLQKITPKPIWHAEPDVLALEMCIACAFGQPLWGFILIVAHSVLTQLVLARP